MKKKIRKETPELSELLAEIARLAMVLIGQGLDIVEDVAKRKNLFKKYTYLNDAIKNVKNAIPFLTVFFIEKTKGVTKNAGHKRTKSNKKI